MGWKKIKTRNQIKTLQKLNIMKKILPLLSLLVILASCNSKENKLILKSSTGRINSALLVIDNNDWDGAIGTTLKDAFTDPIEGLPQPEPPLSLTQISPSKFNSLFENNRNTLVVGIESHAQFKIVRNKYASPQTIISVIGTNQNDLINQIKTHQQEIIDAFKSGDLALYQRKISDKIWETNQFKILKNTDIKIPKNYLKVTDTLGFLWLRRHLHKDGAINVLVYKIPLARQDSISLSYLISQRNQIGKQHIPGQFDNTYMQTSTEMQPTFRALTINGIKSFEIRGLWEVKNDFMGGAFINYTFVDTALNQLICLDGFVYAPNQDKRDYIFELEAIFKTFILK